MLGYIPPDGASEANVARARALCSLRKNRWNAKERQKHAGEDTLEELAKLHDPCNKRWKARNVLRNQEFLVALILLGEERGDAVPPGWQEPMDHLCNNKKRCRTDAFASAAVPVQPAALQFDFMDPDRYLVASNPLCGAAMLTRAQFLHC